MFCTLLVYNRVVSYTQHGGDLLNTQFKKGVLELCILQVISKKEMYGFEIIDSLANILDVNENTIYPILRRLTTQGLFEVYEKESPFGARRKYYKITNIGEVRLEKQLEEWENFLESVNTILKEGELE